MFVLTLYRTAQDRAEAKIGDRFLADFVPATLLVDQPLFSSHPVPADPITYGQQLFTALGDEALRTALAPLPHAPHEDSMIVIHTDDPDLASIPWEYLHDGDDFLIFTHLLVREIPDAPLPSQPDPLLPWRLVAMSSEPLLQEAYDQQTGISSGYVPLRRWPAHRKLDLLRDTLLSQDLPVPIRWQRIAPNRQMLADDLATVEPVLFHYTGPCDMVDDHPLLCFDDGSGCMDPYRVADLAANMRGMVYFAFMNACRTNDNREPSAQLPLALIRNGIPVVLDTQYQALDDPDSAFAATFYHHLAKEQHPAQALYQARLKLRELLPNEPRTWAVPLLYVAQHYTWQVQRPTINALLPTIEPPLSRIEALQEPEKLFGRDIEVMEIARRFVFDKQRIITIRGPGGIGKTALVSMLATRLRFYFHDGIYALNSALNGPTRLSAAAVRRKLANLLRVQHKAFSNPDAIQVQEEALVRAINDKQHLLLICDNYETVLRELEHKRTNAAIDEAEAIQRLMYRLFEAGAHLLFTSHQPPVGLPGEILYPAAVLGHQLGGIDLRSSVQLLRAYVKQRTVGESFLIRIAAAVDASPLAMQLVASRWDLSNEDETTFLDKLNAELQRTRDPALVRHQHSALINVQLSVNALPPDLRHDLMMLTIIANPVIKPIHGAVVWGFAEETKDGATYQEERAHNRLEELRNVSLLQGNCYDSTNNRALTYNFQPVVTEVLADMVKKIDLEPARTRYAQWADELMSQDFSESTISDNISVAPSQFVQAMLPDLVAALPLLSEEQGGWASWRAATILRQFGQPDQAQYMLELAEKKAQKTDDQKLLSRVYHEQANDLLARNDLDGAMRLYEQSLAVAESLGDMRGKSATLHQVAGALATHGDLEGALLLYEQSLTILEALGDRQSRSATLANMAVVQFRQGERHIALQNAQESLQVLRDIGATEKIEKVEKIIRQMKAIATDKSGLASADISPIRLLGTMLAAVTRALRREIGRDGPMTKLQHLSANTNNALLACATALLAALDNVPNAAAMLFSAVDSLLANSSPAERADILVGIGNLAELLGDATTELRARAAAVTAFRNAGEDSKTLNRFSITLYNLAIAHARKNDFVAAIPLLEEVVSMDVHTGHPDLASDWEKLEEMRRLAAEQPIRDLVTKWREGRRDDKQFEALLHLICNLCAQVIRNGSPEQQQELAQDLAYLRASRPLPLASAADFLNILQMLLRNDPKALDRSKQIRSSLEAPLAQMLAETERLIHKEADAAKQNNHCMPLKAMLDHFPPEQQTALASLNWVAPLLQQSLQLLRNPDAIDTDRTRYAEQLEHAAKQAATGKAEGSPQLAAAATLREVASWLRGTPPDTVGLPASYRELVVGMLAEKND
ncbi:MAG: CHAT domain-containing protein [Chloroflexales bacterium]|nr:CHAT domain-containing protein [Chloroflexales bacterium]